MTAAYKHLLYNVRIITDDDGRQMSEDMVLDGSEVERNFTWGKAIIGLDTTACASSATIDHGRTRFEITPYPTWNGQPFHRRDKGSRRCEDCQ